MPENTSDKIIRYRIEMSRKFESEDFNSTAEIFRD